MNPTKYELDNGLTVILQPKPAAPVVACNVWVDAGSADEEPSEAGVAHIHEHMLFKGTERRGVGEIAREVEASGGRINAFTSFDQTCYFVTLSSRFLDAGLDILSDAIQHSAFDPDELDRELEVIQEEIKRTKDTPSKMAGLKLFETAFSEHPYRNPIIGTEESVDSMTREDVRGFFERHYVPDNMAVVVAGDFDSDEIRAKIDEYFGTIVREGTYEAPERTAEPPQEEIRTWSEARELRQTHLRISFHIPHATHEDIPALDLLSAILGYGDASHLVRTIEHDRQWVNSIAASAYTPKDAGLFIVSADYQLGDEEDRTHEETVGAILEETFRFRDVRPGREEVDRARTIIESQEIYGKQTVGGLARKLGRFEMVTGDPNYERKYQERLAEVEPEDVRRVAERYLTPANGSVVAMYPEGTGPVEADAVRSEVESAASEVARDAAVASGVETDEDNFARVELPAGPTLIVQEDHSVETFAIRGLALGGVRYETPEAGGVNKLLSQLITRGTEKRAAEEISHEVESMAGSLSGLSGRNTSGLSMSGLSRFFEESFEIFADALLNPAIPEEEFEREKMMLVQNIRGRRDRLGAVNFDQFLDRFFSPHPYGRPKVGTKETVASLESEDVRRFHDHVIAPEDLVLSVAGDVDPEEVVRLAERWVSGAEGSDRSTPEIPEPPERDGPELVVGDLEKEQAHVAVGFDAPPLASEEKYALRVLHAILSGQGGRLFYQLRDRQSLAYSVHAKPLLGLDASTFTVLIGTSPEKIEEAVRGIFREIERVRAEPVTRDEIERAERYLIGIHDIGLQKNSSRALSVGLDELYGLGYKRSLRYGDAIGGVDRDDVLEVARTYLDPDRSVTSITKPESVEVPPKLADDVVGELD